MSMIVGESRAPYQLAISNELIEPNQQETIMKLSQITAAIFLSASAISAASAQAQTISVNPQTLIVNFAAGENPLARIAQAAPAKVVPATVTAPAVPSAAPAVPAPAPSAAPPTAAAPAPEPYVPVEVPAYIGGQKINADAQRVTKCLIEHHGDKYICGMLELNGEIAKCVGGVGTVGGCFTAPLTRPYEVSRPAPRVRNYYTRTNYIRAYANQLNVF
jgi:hypothetical protein